MPQLIEFIKNWEIKPALTKPDAEYCLGGRIAECCGSQLVEDLTIDRRNKGITLAINAHKTKVRSTSYQKIQSFEIDGVWFNFKLNRRKYED